MLLVSRLLRFFSKSKMVIILGLLYLLSTFSRTDTVCAQFSNCDRCRSRKRRIEKNPCLTAQRRMRASRTAGLSA